MENKGLNKAAQRIQRELKEIRNENFVKNGISVEIIEDNFMKLTGKILGPAGTPYEGGIYILKIEIPDGYPFKPVKVRFLTKIWHPNISSVTGAICLNILNKDWVACVSLRTVLLSLQALLSAAEPDDPLDAVVAHQYTENHELFKLTARHWSQVYAGAPGYNEEFEERIRKLVDMGIDEERALVALSSRFWDVTKAIQFIF